VKKLLGFLSTLATWGAPGLLLLALLDGIGVPIPLGVDALLIALCANRPERLVLFALTAVVGSSVGTYILYDIARRGGEAYLHKHSLSRGGARFRRWFQHYGLLTVFISALIPFPTPMKIFVISSGATCASRSGFLAVIIGARLARYFALGGLGAAMGNDALAYISAHKWDLALIAAGLFVFLFILVKVADALRTRRISRQEILEGGPEIRKAESEPGAD
jgi:membrane protein YqaA with SNARE-associated domain